MKMQQGGLLPRRNEKYSAVCCINSPASGSKSRRNCPFIVGSLSDRYSRRKRSSEKVRLESVSFNGSREVLFREGMQKLRRLTNSAAFKSVSAMRLNSMPVILSVLSEAGKWWMKNFEWPSYVHWSGSPLGFRNGIVRCSRAHKSLSDDNRKMLILRRCKSGSLSKALL